MKRLPSIQQVACHEDTKYNLIVLLCNNGKLWQNGLLVLRNLAVNILILV